MFSTGFDDAISATPLSKNARETSCGKALGCYEGFSAARDS